MSLLTIILGTQSTIGAEISNHKNKDHYTSKYSHRYEFQITKQMARHAIAALMALFVADNKISDPLFPLAWSGGGHAERQSMRLTQCQASYSIDSNRGQIQFVAMTSFLSLVH